MRYGARVHLRAGARLLCALTGAVLALEGCAPVGPDFTRPAAKLQADWVDAQPIGAAPTGDDSNSFWASFHDATLLELIKKGDAQSPTLLSAVELMSQAQSQIRIDQGSRLPNVNLAGASQYGQPTLESQLRGQNAGATTDSLLGQLNWEIDFWGRLRRAVESDRASLQSARAGLAAARVSLEASVASAYCNVRTTERRIVVAQANLVQQFEDKRIAEAKFRLGATSERDYRQAEAQYEQTKAQLPQLKQALAQYQHSLSVLVGETPDYFETHQPPGTGLPDTPDVVAIGAPRDLLRRRPDVLQAEYNAAAQSARIGIAQAALYPTFSLSGEFGYVTTGSPHTLFRWDNRAVQYGAGFTLPIFDRGRLKAQVRIEDSLFRQSLLAYQNQVLSAQQDVEDSLASVIGEQGQVAELGIADAAAARAARLALDQYRAGQADYTTVTSAEQTHAQTSDALVQAQGGVLLAHISVYRALGGGWQPDFMQTRDQGAQR